MQNSSITIKNFLKNFNISGLTIIPRDETSFKISKNENDTETASAQIYISRKSVAKTPGKRIKSAKAMPVNEYSLYKNPAKRQVPKPLKNTTMGKVITPVSPKDDSRTRTK